MRDDSVLYTGANSASLSVEKEQPVRREAHQEKQEKRAKLLPAAQLVMDAIDKEKVRVRDIRELDVENMFADEHFKAELMARKKYITYLENLKNHMENVLREHKKEKQ